MLHGSIWDEANEKAEELVEERGLTYIHPFDDPILMAGQGGVGLELIEDIPDLDVVIVPIGGGGLISGISMAVKSIKPDIKVIGVEAAGAPAMYQSIQKGQRIILDKVTCIIDGLVVKQVGENTFAVVQDFVDDIVLVSDEEIFRAIIWIMDRCKLVAEGAAAASVAALLQNRISGLEGKKVACILSGGNLNLAQLHGLTWN